MTQKYRFICKRKGWRLSDFIYETVKKVRTMVITGIRLTLQRDDWTNERENFESYSNSSFLKKQKYICMYLPVNLFLS